MLNLYNNYKKEQGELFKDRKLYRDQKLQEAIKTKS